MLLGLISDTHDQLARTRLAVAKLREAGASALIHCGDLTTPAIIEVCSFLPLWFVFGNNDDDMGPHLRQSASDCGAICLGQKGLITLGGRTLGITHGHMRNDVNELLSQQPDFLFTGHSHIPHDAMAGKTRRINPGALHRAEKYTVATLDLDSGLLTTIEVTEKGKL